MNENVMPNNQFFTLQLHPVIGEMKLLQYILFRILITMYSENFCFYKKQNSLNLTSENLGTLWGWNLCMLQYFGTKNSWFVLNKIRELQNWYTLTCKKEWNVHAHGRHWGLTILQQPTVSENKKSVRLIKMEVGNDVHPGKKYHILTKKKTSKQITLQVHQHG